MKIRTNYVSNSSSSSYLVVYDEKTFDKIMNELKKAYLGMSKITENLDDFLELSCVEEEIDNWKNKIDKYKKSGKKVMYMDLEYDYDFIINLLSETNNLLGGDKIEFIKGDVY